MTRHSTAVPTFAFLVALTVFAAPARAQSPVPPQDPSPTPEAAAANATTGAAAQPADDAGKLDPLEPDFALVNLPTTLRLPVHGGNFHLTHRFNLNLRCGSNEDDCFSSRINGLFGLDSGANIGLEFRFGLMRNLQGIVQRTSIGQTIQFSVKYDAVHQNAGRPVSVSGVASIEGENNFHNNDRRRAHFAPALGFVVSREVGDALAIYLEPFWVHNTANEGQPTRDTSFLGIGARVRLGSTVNLVGEVLPRLAGLQALDDPLYGFAIEKRVGAHVFALTFTNRPATTFRQIAQGGTPTTLNLGFNLTRKFF